MLHNIYDSAVKSFEMAANLMIALQRRRFVLTGDAAALLNGRPKALLVEGYNSLSPRFGICIPQDTKGEFTTTPGGEGLEFRNSGANWMTMEGLMVSMDPCSCYLDADAAFPTPTIVDVFLRDFTDENTVRDTLHTEWVLGNDRAAICKLELPKAADDIVNRRIIMHLRYPPVQFTLNKLAITLI